MKRLIAGAICVLCVSVLFALPAHGGSIPISAVVGNGLLVNFDFTGQVPGPPYAPTVEYGFTFSGLGAGEVVSLDRYRELDANNLFMTTTVTGPGVGFSVVGANSTILDGMFSVVLRLNAGAANLDSAFACAPDCTSPVVTITGVTPTDIPEPATFALVGLGLAGLGFARRKKLPGRSDN